MPATLGQAAERMMKVATEWPLAEHEALEQAAIIVEKEAKRVIGTYDYDWPALKPETVARKTTGDAPLLETGEMRDSIEHRVGEGEAFVGTNNKKAIYHELGTKTIPPRSFLAGAGMHKKEEIHELTGRVMAAAISLNKP